MPYPKSPFADTFDSRIIACMSEGKPDPDTLISNEECRRILSWLCSSPKITSYRVNTIKINVEEVTEAIKKHASLILGERCVNMDAHPLISNAVIIYHDNINNELEKHDKEIIVDVDCGAAVLRGAHIYAPGVMGMMGGTHIDDNVSIYVDVTKKCRRGLQKLYECTDKIFIGNGVAKMMRHQLFGENLKPSGVAVQITETISGCPPLGDNFLPPGWALLQNLTSMLCVKALDPKPFEKVIDLCASPGNKTTHIAELMQNKGTLVAIDKNARKVASLKAQCEEFGANVSIFEADSREIVHDDENLHNRYIEEGPPFGSGIFDKVLLDAPCTALGKRPQFVNTISEKVIKAFARLQKRLFHSAVKLLKVNGRLVYSTCTITLAENEDIVSWALQTFKCLELIKPDVCLGGPGWKGTSLTEEECNRVQRFGPDQEVDSVGFFFACFIKREINCHSL